MRFKNKQILVYGMGDSGRSVIKILKDKKAYVSFYDDNPRFFDYVGFEKEPLSKKWDLVIVSPGVMCRGNKILQGFEERKIPVISELDFAYKLCRGKIIGITGTNGKTTVSMLVAKILHEAGKKEVLCGNIGLPFSAVAKECKRDSIVVCEVSNFQLETSKHFRADVGCVLNIKPDHLDRHGSFEEYVRVKSILAKTAKKKVILNFDDEEAKKLIFGKNYMFFSKKPLKKGVFLFNNQIFIDKKSVLNLSQISLPGEKNLENVLAAIAICSQFDVPDFAYARAIENFVPANHRMQIVGKIDGVTYVDDSKATNVASTVACIQAFSDKKLLLLLGGLGKDIDYSPIFKENANIKCVVCFGADREKICECAQKHHFQTKVYEKFVDAVLFCINEAESGDFVLLSPACASFDEFSSYAERGDKFSSLVLGCEL